MSMLDSFFNKGFRGSKCKTLLKLTIPRIKLLRNRRELQLRQMRKEIAKLLETGQEATARIRVEHIVREENMMAAQEIIELFSELISVRLPIIENQRECPLDLKEAISSLCFAAPRCADLPELMQVQMAFASKYGKEFVAAATELMPNCGVNRQLIELLSVRAPSADKKITLLKEIAEEHGVDWDPAASETELFKSHEDLLDGSTQYITGNEVPLPKEKHEEVLQSVSSKVTDEQYDSDSGLDFPEVPTSIMRPTAGSEEYHPPSAPHPEVNQTPAMDFEKLAGQTSKEPEQARQTSKEPEQDDYLPTKGEMPKQFVPFISAPSLSPQQSANSFQEPALDFKSSPLDKYETDPLPEYPLKTKNEKTEPSSKFDLKDVLLAAQAAAESAERAASAARSAASLAQLRISELSSKTHEQSPDVLPDNPFGMDSSILSATTEETQHLERQISSADSDESTKATHSVFERQTSGQHLDRQISSADSYDSSKANYSVFERQASDPFVTESPGGPTFDHNEPLFTSSSFDEARGEVNPQQAPHRLTSEDDLLGSYPNLFGSGGHSFTENARSNK